VVAADCPRNSRACESCDSGETTDSRGGRAELQPGGAFDGTTLWGCRGTAGGVHALERRGGGGAKPTYGMGEREQIVAQARRCPQPARDGTATWSLQLLQRALRKSDPQHLGRISTYTIWAVLHEAGLQWGRTRSWCDTGSARRKRKSGVVTVSDPDTEAKKT
jgi:hypothetical protein